MSWIQLHDEVWPATKDEADLRVYVHPPDVGCPRVSWDLDVSHTSTGTRRPGRTTPAWIAGWTLIWAA